MNRDCKKDNKMIIEEYKKELENWKEEHTNFYNECLHAMKNRKATLGAFMHSA